MFSSFIKITLVAILLVGLSWIFIFSKDQKNLYYLSPIPDYLTLGKNNQVKFLDLWLPFFDKPQVQGAEDLSLTAKSFNT